MFWLVLILFKEAVVSIDKGMRTLFIEGHLNQTIRECTRVSIQGEDSSISSENLASNRLVREEKRC